MSEGHDGRFDELVERLTSEVDPPSDDDLRDLARTATAEPRAAPRPSRFRRPMRPRRTGTLVVASLLLASALGFGVGNSLTPSGDAASPTAGLGFVPEPGWYVHRSPFEATAERPSFAIASSVPLAREDAIAARQPEFSGHPYMTVRSLRAGAVVLVATFQLRAVHEASDASFPAGKLPLRLRDGTLIVRTSLYGGPISSQEIRAAVGDHNVIVNAYFGGAASKASVLSAQRQLDRLVVGSTRPVPRVERRAFPLAPRATTSREAQATLVDRTFTCRPLAFGGVGDLDIVVSPTRDDVIGRLVVAALEIRTGGSSSDDTLVIARSRAQPFHPGLARPRAAGGMAGVFASFRRCSSVSTRVALSAAGLAGPPTRFERSLDCPVRGRVVIRVRSLTEGQLGWRRVDRIYAGVPKRVVEAKVSVRTQRGRPIAYMELDRNERTRLWFASGCT